MVSHGNKSFKHNIQIALTIMNAPEKNPMAKTNRFFYRFFSWNMNVTWTNTNKNAYMYRYIMHIWTPIIEPFGAADSSGKKFNARLVSNLNFPETNISTCTKTVPEKNGHYDGDEWVCVCAAVDPSACSWQKVFTIVFILACLIDRRRTSGVQLMSCMQLHSLIMHRCMNAQYQN